MRCHILILHSNKTENIESQEQCSREDTNLKRNKLWQNWIFLQGNFIDYWEKGGKFTSAFIWWTCLYKRNQSTL